MIKLKEIRKARGMTQGELAAKVAHADPTVDQMVISVLERGELYPSEKLRDALCEALGCTEADLYDGVEAFFVPAPAVEYSESTKMLASVLGRGAENAVSREQLSILTGMKDRKMREKIEKARQEGLCIANEQNGAGYYIPITEAEIRRQWKINQNRAISVLRQQKHLKERLNEC